MSFRHLGNLQCRHHLGPFCLIDSSTYENSQLVSDGWGPTVWILLATRTFTKKVSFSESVLSVLNLDRWDHSCFNMTPNWQTFFRYFGDCPGWRMDCLGCGRPREEIALIKRTSFFFGEKPRPFGGHSGKHFVDNNQKVLWSIFVCFVHIESMSTDLSLVWFYLYSFWSSSLPWSLEYVMPARTIHSISIFRWAVWCFGFLIHIDCVEREQGFQQWRAQNLQIQTWVFPKIGVPPNHSVLIGFSIINHPFWGTPIFGNTHMGFRFWSFCFYIL